MTARLWEAIGACITASALLLIRLSMKEAALFGLTLFLIYLPGYLISRYLPNKKRDAIKSHITSFAFGISTIIIASFVTMQLKMMPSFITSIITEGAILFVIGNIILFKKLANEN